MDANRATASKALAINRPADQENRLFVAIKYPIKSKSMPDAIPSKGVLLESVVWELRIDMANNPAIDAIHASTRKLFVWPTKIAVAASTKTAQPVRTVRT